LPKGLVEADETPEAAALREVKEEAGLDTVVEAPLDVIEYWYVATERGERVRFHKFVHLFLLRATGGDVRRHDREVLEARWVPLAEAGPMLAFESERRAMEEAMRQLGSR
jgi:8-oxo-dGTP pyrophosphatase MutT (NUDIX family)